MQEAIETLEAIPGVEKVTRLNATHLDENGKFKDSDTPLEWGLRVEGSNILVPSSISKIEEAAFRARLIAVIDNATDLPTDLQVERERSMGWHVDGVYNGTLDEIRHLKKSGTNVHRVTRTGFCEMENPEFQRIFWEEVSRELQLSVSELIGQIRGSIAFKKIIELQRADVQALPEAMPKEANEEVEALIGKGTRFRDIRSTPLIHMANLFLSSSDFIDRLNQRLCQAGIVYFHDYSGAQTHQVFWKDTNQASSTNPHMLHSAWYKPE